MMSEEVCEKKALNTIGDIDHLIETLTSNNSMFKRQPKRTFFKRWCCCFYTV